MHRARTMPLQGGATNPKDLWFVEMPIVILDRRISIR